MATRKCDESVIDNICIVFDLKVKGLNLSYRLMLHILSTQM